MAVRGWEALPVGWEGLRWVGWTFRGVGVLGDSPRGLGEVGRPYRKARRGWESLQESWERSVDPSGKPQGTGQCRKALLEGREG